MKKILAIALALVMVFALGACGEQITSTTGDEGAKPPVTEPEKKVEPKVEVDETKLKVVIETDYGKIHVTLAPEMAPITVANFQKLVSEGFYDGLTFHRVIEGFMIQGGAGNAPKTIKGEFAANGVNNTLAHERGVISMARAYDFNSASSQFFIMHEAAPHLDGQYAAFGQVTKGIEVVDAIVENSPVVDNNGTVLAEDQIHITSIYFE